MAVSRRRTFSLKPRSTRSPNSTMRARSPADWKHTFIGFLLNFDRARRGFFGCGGGMADEINLNADMGEGFGAYDIGDDAGLLKIIRSASIACGFHAGDPMTMQRVVTQAAG